MKYTMSEQALWKLALIQGAVEGKYTETQAGIRQIILLNQYGRTSPYFQKRGKYQNKPIGKKPISVYY